MNVDTDKVYVALDEGQPILYRVDGTYYRLK